MSTLIHRYYGRYVRMASCVALLILLMAACGGTPLGQQNTEEGSSEQEGPTNQQGSESSTNPLVTIEMESGEQIKIELYPDIAPNTVANFISLIEQDFYEGLIFHRVIPGFMIQGGDPVGNGTGDPGYSIKGEFTDNGFENKLSHERGVISMARTQIPDSAGSQFFIMVEDVPELDGQYAAFGKVLEGMEAVDEIVQAKRDQQDKPLEDQRMKKVNVETFGVEYGPPEKIE